MTVIFEGRKAKGFSKAVQHKKYRFRKLLALGPDKMITIEHMLFSGTTPLRLAEIMRTDWGFFKEGVTDSLARLLRDYKLNILLPKILLATKGFHQHGKDKATKALEIQKNIALEFNTLIDVQKTRLEKALATEKKSPFVNESATRELKALQGLLKDLGRYQVEAGMVRKFEEGGVINFNQNLAIQQLNFKALNTSQVAEATQKALEVLAKVKTPEVIDV